MAAETEIASSSQTLSQMEAEVIEIFVRAAQLIGLPKSYGEIYGLLFLSSEPLAMDQIMRRLSISLGSASQGLKQLRAFRAVKTTYVPGQRRDFFVAETEFRKLVAGWVSEEVFPHLESAGERLASIRALLDELPDGENGDDQLNTRLEKLERWHKLGGGVVKQALKFINF